MPSCKPVMRLEPQSSSVERGPPLIWPAIVSAQGAPLLARRGARAAARQRGRGPRRLRCHRRRASRLEGPSAPRAPCARRSATASGARSSHPSWFAFRPGRRGALDRVRRRVRRVRCRWPQARQGPEPPPRLPLRDARCPEPPRATSTPSALVATPPSLLRLPLPAGLPRSPAGVAAAVDAPVANTVAATNGGLRSSPTGGCRADEPLLLRRRGFASARTRPCFCTDEALLLLATTRWRLWRAARRKGRAGRTSSCSGWSAPPPTSRAPPRDRPGLPLGLAHRARALQQPQAATLSSASHVPAAAPVTTLPCPRRTGVSTLPPPYLVSAPYPASARRSCTPTATCGRWACGVSS